MTDSNRDRDAAQPEQLDDETERTRRLILERRNRFMAAALAGIGMAAGACTSGGDSGVSGARPTACLSAGSIAIDPTSGRGGSGGSGGSGGTRPSVCLGAVDPCAGDPPPCELEDGGVGDGGEQT